MADNDLIRRGDAMREGYRTCAETRHVTLGQKVETAILAIPAAQVTVKPLEWRETNDGNHRKGDIYSARSLVNFAPIAVHKKHDGWWLNVDCKTYPTIEAAKAAAQADYDARIRAALTVTPHNPAKVQALVEAVPTTAAERDALSERSRQCVVEGWDTEHDDIHTEGELAKAAACYAWMAAQSDGLRSAFDRPPPTWPAEWDEYWWKPTTPRRDLVKAAALIIAEIERLDRAALAAMKEV